jgi:3-oxoacyl-[acyl-carrier protein] reductase
MNTNLSGHRAVVCGSSQGIGRAIAIELSRLGADITLMARNPERLESVVRELDTDSGQKHEMIVADFSEPAQVKIGIDQFVGKKKTASILINNTGGPPGGLAIEAKVNEYIDAFQSHLICNQILAQALVPGMKHKGYGRIVNVISTSVKQPIEGLGVSNTIRGAVANWSKTLANELGPFGITVNNILPGTTRTARLDQIILARSKKTGESVEEVTRQFESAIPAGRFAEPKEIAAVAAFLASPAASYVNGINLPVDGGRTACL